MVDSPLSIEQQSRKQQRMAKNPAGRAPSRTKDSPKQSIQVITRAINVLRAPLAKMTANTIT
jgi:hypothetical protein